MKRLISACLAVCLLCGALYGAALADDGALRVIDKNILWTQEYQEAYPNRAIENIPVTYGDAYYNNDKKLLLQSGDWDVALVRMGGCDGGYTLQELYELGMLLDLGGQDALAAMADTMVSSVRDALTIGRQLVGLPGFFAVKGMNLSISEPVRDGETVDLLARLGFSQADLPTTYAGLADFAQAYIALPDETKQGTTLGTLWYHDGKYDVSLLGDMIDLYTADCCDANGNLMYDTPEFRACLEDWRRLRDAVAEDRKRQEDKDSYSLFTEQNGRNLNIHIADTQHVATLTDVYVINADSPHVREAVDYVLLALTSSSVDYGAMWDMLYDQQMTYHDMAMAYYDREIESISAIPAGDDRRNAWQPILDRVLTARASEDEACFAELRYLTRSEFDNMQQTVLPNLTFHPLPHFSGHTVAEQFIQNGTLDAEGLIRFLETNKTRGYDD